jgi:hypothetical protein
MNDLKDAKDNDEINQEKKKAVIIQNARLFESIELDFEKGSQECESNGDNEDEDDNDEDYDEDQIEENNYI